MKILKSLSLATLLLALPALAPSAHSQSAGISGERAYARITRSKQALTVNPNQVGNFPTIDVVAQKSIKIEVTYPAGLANEKVTLKALEGRNLGNGHPARAVKCAEAGHRFPWRHVAALRDRHDHRRAAPHLVDRLETERRVSARPMATAATGLNDRGDVARKRHRPRRLRRQEVEDAAEQQRDHRW